MQIVYYSDYQEFRTRCLLWFAVKFFKLITDGFSHIHESLVVDQLQKWIIIIISERVILQTINMS